MKKHFCKVAVLFAAVSLVFVLAGCPDADPDLEGTVSIEGAEPEDGTLRAGVDDTLTANFTPKEGADAPAESALKYEWQSRAGDTDWNIVGTTKEYQVQAADENGYVRVVVSAAGFYGEVVSGDVSIGAPAPKVDILTLDTAYCATYLYNSFNLAITDEMYEVEGKSWNKAVETMDFMIEHKATGYFVIEIVEDWQGNAWAIQPKDEMFGTNCIWTDPLLYIGPNEDHNNIFNFNDPVLKVGVEGENYIRIWKTLGTPDTQITKITFYSRRAE